MLNCTVWTTKINPFTLNKSKIWFALQTTQLPITVRHLIWTSKEISIIGLELFSFRNEWVIYFFCSNSTFSIWYCQIRNNLSSPTVTINESNLYFNPSAKRGRLVVILFNNRNQRFVHRNGKDAFASADSVTKQFLIATEYVTTVVQDKTGQWTTIGLDEIFLFTKVILRLLQTLDKILK